MYVSDHTIIMRNRYTSLSYLEGLKEKIEGENAKRARFLVYVDSKIR